MFSPKPVTDLLIHRAMPAVGAALRARAARIAETWRTAVEKYLPDADPLTSSQVRNSIPRVLEQIARALESDAPEATYVLEEVGTAHGVARFQENYSVEQLVVEYRLLRRVVFDEMLDVAGRDLTLTEAVAIDMGIDTALQRGVVTFVGHLTGKLNAAASAESKYLAYLSHDLRNNLNAVTLMLQLLSRQLAAEPKFAEQAKDVAALHRSVFETIEGMDRLLQAERLRRQAVELRLGPVDLHALAETVAGNVRRKAEAKGLTLVLDVPPDAKAHSDRELVTLVLQNLLGNAVKYSATGTVRLYVRRATSGLMAGAGWQVGVSDEGPGIGPDKLDTLFREFSRGETHGQAGVGLGLTIASHAARLLGDELHVESEVGKGATFTFTLPPATAG